MTSQIFTIVWKAILTVTLVASLLAMGGQDLFDHTRAQAETTATPSATNRLFLPIIGNKMIFVMNVNAVETLDNKGTSRSAYLPGDTIFYRAYGDSPEAGVGEVVWVEEGPCGMRLIYAGKVSEENSRWGISTLAIAPNCPGIYSQTFQMTHLGQTSIVTSVYAINEFSGQVQVSQRQAFDKCDAPSLYSLREWWDDSYYYGFNLYLGGISRYCDNENLSGSYIHEAKEMGWWFIPTWVGPQAPCTNFKYRISWDPDKAYAQGRQEAWSAMEAAADLGLRGEQIIYYDLENYGYTASRSCRATVAEFIRGWTERLHESGAKSGVYGGGTSYLTDFPAAGIAVDDIWVAAWLAPYMYRPDAKPSEISWLADSFYRNNRIRQYAGGHAETWGSITLSIDSNVANGEIVALPRDLQSSSTADALGDADLLSVQAMQLVSAQEGWVLDRGRFLWSDDGGETWQERFPQVEVDSYPVGAHFLEEGSGWLASANERGELVMQYSPDRGLSWQTVTLPALELLSPVRSANFDFNGSQHGWVVLGLESSSNFNLGKLLATDDGGKTWELRSLPAGGRVTFANSLQGLLIAEQTGERYLTEDGGRTWNAEIAGGSQPWSRELRLSGEQAAIIAPPGGEIAETTGVDSSAWVIMRTALCQGDKIPPGQNPEPTSEPFACTTSARLLKTGDSGKTWAEINLP